ncbi:MAG: Acyl-coenzyme A:6-aminopenicillanic acid acyl-transferase [Myxococcaceae bacterium]|nr:Acyl-coenzyme A:6-aminopenicillanic acid acyl-transferase [Myxococcaceae bacterium]
MVCRLLRRSLLLFLCVSACVPTQPPATREIIHLHGNAYERGKQHGEKLKSKIHSFYTTLLTASLFPYLGREQPVIASLLNEYDGERYQNGQFAYQLLLDSAKTMEKSLTKAQRDELRGISDGSGLSYDEVLVLNTFVDSVLAVRGIALAIRLSRAPLLTRLEFVGALSDGADNDGDGLIDEAGEGIFDPFVPDGYANAVELLPNTTLKLTFQDPQGVDQESMRLVLNGQIFTRALGGLAFESPAEDTLVVTFTPPAALAAGSTQTLVVTAGDKLEVTQPPPAHLSFMRDEELLFTVQGAGLTPAQVKRPALTGGRTRPPPVGFALTGAASTAGPLLGHHFALLDANTAHKHTVVTVHHPDDGSPAYATVGWAGVAYGLVGMSERGVGYACNPSDTLDNSVVGSVLEQVADLSKARLNAKGTPIGFVGRKVLETAGDTLAGIEVFKANKHVYGWNCLIADSSGLLRSVEVDSDVFKSGDSVFTVAPADRDAAGERIASVNDESLIAASAYRVNTNDVITLNLAGQRVVPQKVWSTFFYRSRRVVDAVARKLTGPLSVEAAEALLGDDELVDKSDSMTAAVLELAAKKLHYAIGQVPATSAPFLTFDFNAPESAP